MHFLALYIETENGFDFMCAADDYIESFKSLVLRLLQFGELEV